MGILRDRMLKVMQMRGLAEQTQEVYVYAIGKLARRYGKSPDLLTAQEVQDYVLELAQHNASHSTLQVHAAACRFFFNRVLNRPDVTTWLPPRRQPQRLPEVLTQEELTRLFECAGTFKSRLLLIVTYSAGLRASEVTRLKVTDLTAELEHGRITVRVNQGKASKDRYTFLPLSLLSPLRQFWATHRSPVWLFPAKGDIDSAMNRKSLASLYTDAKRRAGIKKYGGVHTLRHTFATDLLASGRDLAEVQQLLGHSQITTTMRYLRVSTNRFKDLKSPTERLPLDQLLSGNPSGRRTPKK